MDVGMDAATAPRLLTAMSVHLLGRLRVETTRSVGCLSQSVGAVLEPYLLRRVTCRSHDQIPLLLLSLASKMSLCGELG